MSQQTSAGSGLKILGITLLLFGGLFYYIADDMYAHKSESLFAFLSLLLAYLLLPGGVLFFQRARRLAAKVRIKPPEFLLNSEPFVLYLRSFTSDPTTLWRQLTIGTTEEEELASVLRPFGEMVAIGQPGEQFPVQGATRMYANGSEWKQVVLAGMKSASLVVIRAGNSSGLLWELGQAIQTIKPERLLIFVFRIKLQDYNAFAQQVQATLGVKLPVPEPPKSSRTFLDGGTTSDLTPGFIAFSRDWSAAFLPLPYSIVRIYYNDFKKAFSVALRPVFEQLGVPWKVAGRFGA